MFKVVQQIISITDFISIVMNPSMQQTRRSLRLLSA